MGFGVTTTHDIAMSLPLNLKAGETFRVLKLLVSEVERCSVVPEDVVDMIFANRFSDQI